MSAATAALPGSGHRGTAVRHASEVRLLGFRDVRVLVVVVLARIFGTDRFRYLVGPRHISQGRGPGRREDAFILDRHMQLQELAAVLAEDIAVKQPILFFISIECVFYVV